MQIVCALLCCVTTARARATEVPPLPPTPSPYPFVPLMSPRSVAAILSWSRSLLSPPLLCEVGVVCTLRHVFSLSVAFHVVSCRIVSCRIVIN